MGDYTDQELRKLQSIEFEMLRVVDDFCKKNGISYFLDGGSCLGAVRHGGFIPWDDDIDIGMMRSDYERFIRLFEENPPEGYSIHTHLNTENYSYLFAKVYREGTKFLAQESLDAGLDSCIYLDVFPYDPVKDSLDESARERLVNKALWWQRVLYLYYTPNPAIQPTESFRGLKRAICKVAHRLVRLACSPEGLAARYDKCVDALSDLDNEGGTELICCIQDYGCLRYGGIYPTKDVEFEGGAFPAPRDTDAYLKVVYGDYMQLPPVEKRKIHSPEVLDFGAL